MNKHAKTYTTNLDDEDETEICVEYNFTPGTPETGWSGPPENYDPGSGAEVDIVSIKRANGSTVDVTDEQREEIGKAIEQHEIENPDCGPDPDEAYDRMRDDRDWERRYG